MARERTLKTGDLVVCHPILADRKGFFELYEGIDEVKIKFSGREWWCTSGTVIGKTEHKTKHHGYVEIVCILAVPEGCTEPIRGYTSCTRVEKAE